MSTWERGRIGGQLDEVVIPGGRAPRNSQGCHCSLNEELWAREGNNRRLIAARARMAAGLEPYPSLVEEKNLDEK